MKCIIRAGAGALIRPTARMQAKELITDFLNSRCGKIQLEKKIERYFDLTVMMQRCFKLRYMKAQNKRWFGKVFATEIKLASLIVGVMFK